MPTEFGKNKDLVPLLDDYLGLRKPQLAVLVNSPWGSGKTWFIRNYMDYAKQKFASPVVNAPESSGDTPVFCYVSLFDITERKEIDAAILGQMLPVFFSEKVNKFRLC